MRPERKIVAAAVATLAVWLVQLLAGVDVPVGIEGALAVLAGYLIPGETPGWDGPLTEGDA